MYRQQCGCHCSVCVVSTLRPPDGPLAVEASTVLAGQALVSRQATQHPTALFLQSLQGGGGALILLVPADVVFPVYSGGIRMPPLCSPPSPLPATKPAVVRSIFYVRRRHRSPGAFGRASSTGGLWRSIRCPRWV